MNWLWWYQGHNPRGRKAGIPWSDFEAQTSWGLGKSSFRGFAHHALKCICWRNRKKRKKNVWDWSCFYWKISFQSNFFFQQGEFWCWSFYSTLRINVLNFKMCNKKYGSAINKNILITSPRCEGKCDWFFFPLGENWIYKINYWSNYTNFRREMIFRASSGFHENS